jgi:hypothetical protein
MTYGRRQLTIPRQALEHVRRQLLAGQERPAVPLCREEIEITAFIRRRTAEMNRNNITRTAAYWQFYRRFPEVHWAFLAHMVSRNSGWNMTDLRGEWLPRLIGGEQIGDLFLFLETANALIFQDAYPQLLLYAESKKRRANLFHLLPCFHVSSFMKPFWDVFWQTGSSALITVAMIVNEQNYIEPRVVQDPGFQNSVLRSFTFRAQSLLHLGPTLFPYTTPGQAHGGPACRLAGLIMENFANLRERIEFGKQLYLILFAFPDIHKGVLQFAAIPHSGSRADYWPHLFGKTKTPRDGRKKLRGCRLLPGAEPCYSPELAKVWADVPLKNPDRTDWFHDLRVLDVFASLEPPAGCDITGKYCLVLNALETAVTAKLRLLQALDSFF